MKASKQNSKLFFTLVLLVILMLSIVICDTMMTNSVAYADSLIGAVDVQEKCRLYTDSNAPNGINVNEYLNDYVSRLDMETLDISSYAGGSLQGGNCFASTVSYTGQTSYVTASIDGDDNIVKLIPRELFTYVIRLCL